MKKWCIAFIIEFVALSVLVGGFFLYEKDFRAREQVLIEVKQERELERKQKIQAELEAKAEEENRIQRVKELLVSGNEFVDASFAEWLYENYKTASEKVAEQVEEDCYEERMWHQETGKSLYVLRDIYMGLLESETTRREASIYLREGANSDFVSLSFAGDISFAMDYAPAQNYTNFGIDGAFSKQVQETMKKADVFMLNNEFCYTDSTTPIGGKTYTFRASPKLVERLEEMGVDIVSIANNHAYDFGEQGFVDTMNTLLEADVPYVGGGVNLEAARNNIVYFIVNGIKIGYIAATQVERDLPILTQPATEDSAGVIRCYEPELVCEMIEKAEENCDFVIVYPHWGTELVKGMQSDQQALARAFIDAGADAVVGGHPHCLQGVEYYKNVPVFYSLSNFSFSSKVVDSTILNLEITIDGIQSAKYIPCRESNGMTYQCEKGGRDYQEIINLFNQYSANATVDEDGFVTEKTE